MVMVKAFGYGNGGFEIAQLLSHHKVDYLGVAFADEGISLKTAGIDLPIMVMNPETTSFPAIIQHHLEPEIYSLKGLNAFLKIAEEKQPEKLSRYTSNSTQECTVWVLKTEHIDELIATIKRQPNHSGKKHFVAYGNKR